jgi:hypothetical protein
LNASEIKNNCSINKYIWNVLCLNDKIKLLVMQNWLRTLIAGYAGWKWGGGCLGFIAIFALVYFLLGKC